MPDPIPDVQKAITHARCIDSLFCLNRMVPALRSPVLALTDENGKGRVN